MIITIIWAARQKKAFTIIDDDRISRNIFFLFFHGFSIICLEGIGKCVCVFVVHGNKNDKLKCVQNCS